MQSGEPNRADTRSAWLVSAQGVAWSVVSSCCAVALGVTGHSAAMVAFGAIGFVDAAGSVALVYHFRHALRHDALSERLEQISHRVVVIGLLVVGLGAVAVGTVRLATGASGDSSGAGSLLAAVSLGVLLTLSARKISIARRVGSRALQADGRLSALGAMQAGVALFGVASASWLHWAWADALAAGVVGIVAISVSVATWRPGEAA